MKLKRHYLLDITDKGRQLALEKILEKEQDICCSRETVKRIIFDGIEKVKIPGIARRNESEMNAKDTAAVGFSSPFLLNENRLRIPSFIPKSEIKNIVTPYEVVNYSVVKRTKCLEAFEDIKKLAKINNLSLGVWGSVALEIYTGLSYTNDDSDLDILLKTDDYNLLRKFYTELECIVQNYDVQVDLELEVFEDYGIKAVELFMETEFVLAKSITDVKLFPRKEIIKSLLKGGGKHGS